MLLVAYLRVRLKCDSRERNATSSNGSVSSWSLNFILFFVVFVVIVVFVVFIVFAVFFSTEDTHARTAESPDSAARTLHSISSSVLSAAGKLYACERLPHAPVAPPILADFSADGVLDIIVPCASAYLGIRVATGLGSLLQPLLMGFTVLGMLGAVLLGARGPGD